MRRKKSASLLFIGTLFSVGTGFYACKTSSSSLQNSSLVSPVATSFNITGNEYETDARYADKVFNDGIVKDEVPLASYDESMVFDDAKIDQQVDLRLDTFDEVKKLEGEGKLPKDEFSTNALQVDKDNNPIGFSPRKYGQALAKIGRKPAKFAGASVLAAMRRMRRFMYTAPFENKGNSGTGVFLPRSMGIPLFDLDSKSAKLTSFDGKFTVAPQTPAGKFKVGDPLVYSRLEASGFGELDFTHSFDEFEFTWNTDGIGSKGVNLFLMPIYWDEIQAHFYIEPPHRRHGCWTQGLKSTQQQPENARIWASAPQSGLYLRRHAIRDICTGRIFLPDPKTGKMRASPNLNFSAWSVAFAALPVQLSAYNLMWVNPKTGEFLTPTAEIRNDLGTPIGKALAAMQAIQTGADSPSDKQKKLATAIPELIQAVANLPGVQWGEKQREKGYINMWEYIMMHRLYAWDWDQQRDVIMAYYSDHKMARRADISKRQSNLTVTDGDKKAIDPLDKADCDKWIAPRPGDPTGGDQCQLDKKMATPFGTALLENKNLPLSPGR